MKEIPIEDKLLDSFSFSCLRSVPIYGSISGGLIFLFEQNPAKFYVCKSSYTKYFCYDKDL